MSFKGEQVDKVFTEEIKMMYERLVSGKKFAFSKYADGEWAILNNRPIESRGEFVFNPSIDYTYSDKLLESYRFKEPGYYIGVSCPCCQGADTHKAMIRASRQPEDNVTYANIFVNSNYQFYVDNFIPYYKTQRTILVCNRQGKIENLPFKPEQIYYIDSNAYKANYDLIETIKTEHKNTENHLFLFSAGPLGNMLAHQLWETNKNNTYLDIGSTLNPWLQAEGHKRDYYIGKDLSRQICTWG
jgi:hypothetical protein